MLAAFRREDISDADEVRGVPAQPGCAVGFGCRPLLGFQR
jgi:hypothetical protein